MKLTVLGAGTIVPSPQYTQAGYLVELESGKKIVFDFGPGKILRLLDLGIDAWTLDTIFLTHLHLDHTADVGPLLFSKKNGKIENNASLSIYGPSSWPEHYEKMIDLYGGMIKATEEYELEILPFPQEDGLSHEEFRLKAYSMNHFGECLGYRLETDQGVLAYSGDTDMCKEAIELGREADLFVLECAHSDDFKKKGHLTPGEAAEIAREANCKHLVLTHFYPDALALGDNLRVLVEKEFGGRVSLARDLMTFEIGS